MLHAIPCTSFSANDEDRQLARKLSSQYQAVLATRPLDWPQGSPLPPLLQRTVGCAPTKGSGPSKLQLPTDPRLLQRTK